NSVLVSRKGHVPCLEHTNHQARLPRGWQRERREIYFLETSAEKIFLLSAASASPCGASISPACPSPRRSAAPSGSPISTSRARRHLPMKRSWSCSTSCGRASEREKYLVPTGLQASGTCGPERVEFGAPNSVSDGVALSSLPSGESEPSVTLALAPSGFSSGGGLGIHEPGSQTWGGFLIATAPSGRARQRA